MELDKCKKEVAKLRSVADFRGAAATLARGLDSARRQSPAWKIRDGQRLLEYLEFVANLSPIAQAEVAESDRLDVEIEAAFDGGRFSESSATAKRQLEIRRKYLTRAFSPVALSLGNLANSLAAEGEYEAAERFFQEAISMGEQILGTDHPEVASSLSNYASMLQGMAQFERAESLARRALDVRQRLLGPIHYEIAISLHNLGGVVEERDQREATNLFRASLDMMQQTLPAGHPSIAIGMASLGTVLSNLGDYVSAEPLLREALATMRKALGPDHPHVAISSARLAAVLRWKGNYLDAENLLKQAQDTLRSALGKQHPDTVRTIGSLAQIVQARGGDAEAEDLFRSCMRSMEERGDTQQPPYAVCLNSIAALLRKRGEHEEAKRLYRRALEIARASYGNDNWQVGVNLGYLAEVSCSLGDFGHAQQFCDEALLVLQDSTDEAHPELVIALVRQAILQLRAEDQLGAEQSLQIAAHRFERARERVEVGVDRSIFQSSPYPLLALTRLLMNKDLEAWEATESELARGLGDLLADSEASSLSTPREKTHSDKVAQELAELEREAGLLRRAASESGDGVVQSKLVSVEDRLLKAEAEWASHQRDRAERSLSIGHRPYDIAQIQSSLAESEAIIGWFEHSEGDIVRAPVGWDREAVWGYVIRSGGPIRWESLSGAGIASFESITRAEDSYRRECSRRPVTRGAARELADEIARTRIQPLTRHLKGVTRLVVIPSGSMLGIPVETLSVQGQSGSLGSRFSISYAPSATIHAWLRQRGSRIPTAEPPRCLAVGDPPFCETDVEAMNLDSCDDVGLGGPDVGYQSLFEMPADVGSAAIFADTGQSQEFALLRGALGGNREVLASLRRLPGTRREARAVANWHPGASCCLLGEEATEQRLRQLAQEDRLQEFSTLHFATHALVDDERPERSALVMSLVDLPDPLEAAVSGNPVYTGLVTADDIARSWNLNADLVTLSACETGLGKKVAGEGYIGFAHAFLQAGARTVLVSLWNVEDRSTSQLMQRFYENHLGGYEGTREKGHLPGARMTKVAALWEAKQWLRTWADEGGQVPYVHPYFWAGFVLIGE